MFKNSPKSLISYNRDERTFRFNYKLYTIRIVDGIFVMGNEHGVDSFYLEKSYIFSHLFQFDLAKFITILKSVRQK